MTCLECKERYDIPNQPYFPYWCKFWKIYLLIDSNKNPILPKCCEELGGTND
jgi:hypothetical protein